MTDNKKVAEEFWDALNTRNWEKLASLITPDHQHDNDVDYYYGREASIELYKAMSAEGLDFYQKIDRVTAEGDVVICEATWSGNHIMEILGVPATDKSFECPVVYVMDFEHGLVKRLRSVFRDQRFQNAVTE